MKQMKNIAALFNPRIAFLLLFFFLYPEVYSQNYPPFSDTATFILYVNKEKLGESFTWLDSNGNYFREFLITPEDKTLSFEMTGSNIFSDSVSLTAHNSIYGEISARFSSGKVNYQFPAKDATDPLPKEYILYDDYGTLFESLMFKEYDTINGGKQTFSRYRISESPDVKQTHIDVSITDLSTDTLSFNGDPLILSKFDWEIFGLHAVYWIDKECRIYKIESRADNSVSVRKGYESLLDSTINKVSYEKEEIFIPLRDGINLATDIYTPAKNKSPLPVILIRTPYEKGIVQHEGIYWANQGYICAIQDVRGRFSSEGEWEPFVNEGQDGYDVIEWLAAQEWTNGKVGMIGASYAGWAQYLAAVEQPPHLITIIPNVAPPDPFFNIPYEKGAFFTMGSLWWMQVIETEATDDLTGKSIFNISELDYDSLLRELPVIDIDKKLLGRESSFWRNWIKHNSLDTYWEGASYLEKLEQVNIPVFMQSGWFDTGGIGSKLAYERLTGSGNENVKLILGPWGHTDKATTVVSGHFVGEEAMIDLPELRLQWFDYWLKGIGNGIMDDPLVKLYLINANQWVESNTYPPENTEYITFYFGSRGKANTLNGDGYLDTVLHENNLAFDSYVYDPGNPTPSPNQRFKSGGRKNYNEVTSKRDDILIFETEAFEDTVHICGPVSAELFASSNVPDTDWFISLAAIEPNGGSIPVGKGVIRARYRNSLTEPELLFPDKVYRYELDLWQTGITIYRGYRLRAEITSAYFPEFSRNLNTGGHNEIETEFQKAKQNIYHSEEYPSHIKIPIINIK